MYIYISFLALKVPAGHWKSFKCHDVSGLVNELAPVQLMKNFGKI